MTLLPNCCLTVGCLMWKESASLVGSRISGINYGLCDSWLDGPCLTVTHFCTLYFTVLHLRKITFSRWFQQTIVLPKNIPAKFPAKESNHTQCGREFKPAVSEADPFLYRIQISEWSTVVWIGTSYLLIQIFGHFILSKCISSNTATFVSCETTTKCWMLGYSLEEHLRICLLMRGLQMTCVCIGVAKLSLSGIAEISTSWNRFVNWCL